MDDALQPDPGQFFFELPLWLVVGYVGDPGGVPGLSLLSPGVVQPRLEGPAGLGLPLFTDEDLARRYAEKELVGGAVVLRIDSHEGLLGALGEAEAVGYEWAVFDCPGGGAGARHAARVGELRGLVRGRLPPPPPPGGRDAG